MTTEVQMPQMGESVAEGTLVRWFKAIGEYVERDEPLFEISTDKVDTEVPSPTSGYLNAILGDEGDTVPGDTIVCGLAPNKLSEKELSEAETPRRKVSVKGASSTAANTGRRSAQSASDAAPSSTNDRLRTKSSPLVRRLAEEYGVELSTVEGSGRDGRVTKDDLLMFVNKRASATPSSDGDRFENLSPMRAKIAEHMLHSRKTSAHVTTVFEVDMTEVSARRAKLAPEFKKKGTKLTHLAFILREVASALKSFPVLNASIDAKQVRYHGSVNVGIAVALEHGLIVPVVRDADALNLFDLSAAIEDLATRSRSKKLKPEEVQGGTFTITNPGVFGALIGTPIINQPQVAILCLGKIEKRPVVLPGSDTIAARPMVYLSLSYDHRLIDGATADQFLSQIKSSLESEADPDLDES